MHCKLESKTPGEAHHVFQLLTQEIPNALKLGIDFLWGVLGRRLESLLPNQCVPVEKGNVESETSILSRPIAGMQTEIFIHSPKIRSTSANL